MSNNQVKSGDRTVAYDMDAVMLKVGVTFIGLMGFVLISLVNMGVLTAAL